MKENALEERVKSKIIGIVRLCLGDGSQEYIEKETREVVALIGNSPELKKYKNDAYISIKNRLMKRDYDEFLPDMIGLANDFGVMDVPTVSGYQEAQEELIVEPLE